MVGPYCALCFGRCFGSPATIIDFKAPCERVNALLGPPPSNAVQKHAVLEPSPASDEKPTLPVVAEVDIPSEA